MKRVVLLAEDNCATADLMLEIFSSAVEGVVLTVVRDGEEALDYVHMRGAHQNAARPVLIILDVQLPKLDGGAVLQTIRAQNHLRDVPVIMFSSLQPQSEVRRFYEMGANCCVPKSSDWGEFSETVRSMAQFWLSRAYLPSFGEGLES
ncbi:MAG: response regulator [Pseudomonadota bacterium]